MTPIAANFVCALFNFVLGCTVHQLFHVLAIINFVLVASDFSSHNNTQEAAALVNTAEFNAILEEFRTDCGREMPQYIIDDIEYMYRARVFEPAQINIHNFLEYTYADRLKPLLYHYLGTVLYNSFLEHYSIDKNLTYFKVDLACESEFLVAADVEFYSFSGRLLRLPDINAMNVLRIIHRGRMFRGELQYEIDDISSII